MRRITTKLFGPALAMVLAAGLAASAIAQPPYPPIPPPRYERVPPRPGPHSAWVPGHWNWNGTQYVWVEGHYVRRWRQRGHWAPGHWAWAPRAGRWVWRQGRWE